MKNSNFQFLILIIVLLFNFSCGKNDKKSDNSQKSKIVIALIPKGATHEHWKAVHAGAQKAAEELGVEILWKSPIKEDNREEQLEIMEVLIAKGVNAIAISPLDDKVLMRPVKEAKNAGIPTIIFDSRLQGDDFVSFIATDNYQGGVLAAKRTSEILGKNGKLVVFRCQEGSAATAEREQGFLDTIKKERPDINILSDNQYTGSTTETSYKASENMLNCFNDIEAIFTPAEPATFGCLRALQERGLAGKIKLVGFDTSQKLVDALAKKEIYGLVIQDPLKMGDLVVRTAVSCLKGEKIEKFISSGVYIATPENMNDPQIFKLLNHKL